MLSKVYLPCICLGLWGGVFPCSKMFIQFAASQWQPCLGAVSVKEWTACELLSTIFVTYAVLVLNSDTCILCDHDWLFVMIIYAETMQAVLTHTTCTMNDVQCLFDWASIAYTFIADWLSLTATPLFADDNQNYLRSRCFLPSKPRAWLVGRCQCWWRQLMQLVLYTWVELCKCGSEGYL